MRYDVRDIIKDVRICIEENATSDFLLSLGDTETLQLEELIRSKISDAVRTVEMSAPAWMVEGRPLPVGRGGALTLGDESMALGGRGHEEVDAVMVKVEDYDANTYDGGIDVHLQAVDEVDSVVTGRDGLSSSVVSVGTGINWKKSGGEDYGSAWTGWLWLPKDFLRLLVFEMSDWQRPVFDAIGKDDPRYAEQKSRWAGVRGNTESPVVAIVPRSGSMILEFYSCDTDEAKVINASYLAMPQIVDETINISVKLYRAAVYMTASLVALSREDNNFAANLKSVAESVIQ